MGQLRVWAWSAGVKNFGDELGPEVLWRLGYDVARVEEIEDAEFVTCGSLLEHAAANAKPGTKVWGSGLMHGDPVDVSHLDILAVRGKLTAAAISQHEAPTGDPGCLVPILWSKPPIRFHTGVVRHYVDKNDYPWADAVIDADSPVDEVIELIGSCRQVASSSLHGLIVAEAWGLPTLRLPHSDVAGLNFKWADWFVGGNNPNRLLETLP